MKEEKIVFDIGSFIRKISIIIYLILFIYYRFRSINSRYQRLQIMITGIIIITGLAYIVAGLYQTYYVLPVVFITTLPLMIYIIYEMSIIGGYETDDESGVIILILLLTIVGSYLIFNVSIIGMLIYLFLCIVVIYRMKNIQRFFDLKEVNYGQLFNIIYLGIISYLIVFVMPTGDMKFTTFYIIDTIFKCLFVYNLENIELSQY